MSKSTAGDTRKSHKSRKTALPGAAGFLVKTKPEVGAEPVNPESQQSMPVETPAGGTSSTVLAAETSPVPLVNPLGDVLPLAARVTGGDEKSAIKSTGIPEEDPKKQWWWRPADSKYRPKAAKILVQRQAGRTAKEIAKRMGTTEANIRQILYIARKNGWIEGDEIVDVEEELAMSIDRKVVRNISASLDGQMTNWQTHEMTIAAAKGRGHFKNHDVIKGDANAPMQVVAIKVVMPAIGAGDQLPSIGEDQMGGVPAYIDAEVSDVDTGRALEAGDAEPGPERDMDAEFQRPALVEDATD